MRYISLTNYEQSIRAWRRRRNSIICKLLDEDKYLSQKDALKKANKLAGPFPEDRKAKKTPKKINVADEPKTKKVYVMCVANGHLEERTLFDNQLSIGVICPKCS